MKETAHNDETMATTSTRARRQNGAARRRLFVMRTGARLFAVYADEVEATSENLMPTPLPFAPAPVRGVVSRRGRILTLIDPLPLLPGATPAAAPQTSAPATTERRVPFVVVLKGDEQLALSVESIEHEVELYDTEADASRDVDAAADASGGSLLLLPLRRVIPYGAQTVALLDPARLFDAAMQGIDRRRQRT